MLAWMKIFNTPFSIFRTIAPILPIHSFLWETLTLPFSGILRKPISSHPFITEGILTMLIGLKSPIKVTQFQINFLHFKDLKTPHKIIVKSIKEKNSLVYNVKYEY